MKSLPQVTQQAVKGRVGIWIPSALCLLHGTRIVSSTWHPHRGCRGCGPDTGPLPLWVSVRGG